jgi:hypothetical protein
MAQSIRSLTFPVLLSRICVAQCFPRAEKIRIRGRILQSRDSSQQIEKESAAQE